MALATARTPSVICCGRLPPLVSQRITICAPAGRRRAHGSQCIGWVGAQAVKEVFGVVEDRAALLAQIGHRIGDHGQILFGRCLQHLVHLHVPGLADEGNNSCLGRQERLHRRVARGRRALTTRHAEGAQRGMAPRDQARLLEKDRVLGLDAGSRPR